MLASLDTSTSNTKAKLKTTNRVPRKIPSSSNEAPNKLSQTNPPKAASNITAAPQKNIGTKPTTVAQTAVPRKSTAPSKPTLAKTGTSQNNLAPKTLPSKNHPISKAPEGNKVAVKAASPAKKIEQVSSPSSSKILKAKTVNKPSAQIEEQSSKKALKKTRSKKRFRYNQKNSSTMFFIASGALAISATIGVLMWPKSELFKKAETTASRPDSSESKPVTNYKPRDFDAVDDESWGGPSGSTGPVKIYKTLEEAPKGVTLYQEKKSGIYYDVSDVSEEYRVRYTKNKVFYREVHN